MRVRRECTFLWYTPARMVHASTDALQDLLSFLYAECCKRDKAIQAQTMLCCK